MVAPSRTRTFSIRVGAMISSSAACTTGAEHSATSISPQRASVLSIETSARLVVMMRRRQTLTEPDMPLRYWQRNRPPLARAVPSLAAVRYARGARYSSGRVRVFQQFSDRSEIGLLAAGQRLAPSKQAQGD